MNISDKILIFLLIVFCLLTGAFVYFQYEMENVDQANAQLAEEWGELEELQSLQNSIAKVIQSLYQYEQNRSAQVSASTLKKIKNRLENIQQARKNDNQQGHEQRERQFEEDIVRTTKKIISLVEPLSRGETINYWDSSIALAGFSKLNRTIDQYLREDRQQIRGALESSNRTRSRASRRMLAIGILIFGSLVLYSYYIYHSILNPLQTIHSSIRSVARENFEEMVEYDRDDELGEIAHDFNIMIEKLNTAWNTMEEKVEEKSQALLLREKLSTVGEMSSRMAHELNTPLSTIQTAAEGVAKRASQDDDQIRQYAEIMKKEAAHCEQILKRFLEMAQYSSEEKSPIRLDELCRETISMLEFLPEFREEQIQLNVELEPAVVEGHGGLLRQVMFNLLKNGIKSVLSDEAHSREPELDVVIRTHDDRVRFEVEDNGKGFSMEEKEHFFEPFVTTYEGDEGVGLGLSISRQIIDDHGGFLDLESDGPGRGCRAYFELSLDHEESIR